MGLGVFRTRNPCRSGLWHGRVARSADEPGPSPHATPKAPDQSDSGSARVLGLSLNRPSGAQPARAASADACPGPVRRSPPQPSHLLPPAVPPRPTTGPHRPPPGAPRAKCGGASQRANVLSGPIVPPRGSAPYRPIRKRIDSVSDNTSMVGACSRKTRESRNRRSGLLSDRSAYLTYVKQKTSRATL